MIGPRETLTSRGGWASCKARPPKVAQAPGGHGPHSLLGFITLAILEDALTNFSVSEPCRSSLHFSSSSSLEAPQEEQVWLAGGNTISDTVSLDRGPASWRPPAPALEALVPRDCRASGCPSLLASPLGPPLWRLRGTLYQLPSQRQTLPL